MKKLLLFIFFLPLWASAQLTVKEPICMEYWKVLHASDDSLYGYYGTGTVVCLTRSLGKKILKASGGFNRVRAITQDGNMYNSLQYNQFPTPMSWSQVPTDTTGAAFNDNTYIAAFADIYFTIRADGSIWYGGDDRFHFFYPSGTAQMRPTKISPAGVTFVQISIGLRVLARASNGDVYQWTAGNKTAVKITLPRPAIDIAASWYDAQFAIVQKTTGSAYGEPYVWGTAWGSWGSPVSQTLSTPTNLATSWGLASLIKEINVTKQSVHYIDSLSNMFCPASYNVQGEGGFGIEYVNRETYPSYPGKGWTFADWQNPTSWPAVQVGVGVQWDHLYSNNWFVFYKNALAKNGKLYGCGRNKTSVLWMGRIYNPNDNTDFPNDFDESSWREETTPFTKALLTYSHQAPVRGAGGNRTITNNSTTLNFTGHMTLAINGTDTTIGRVVAYNWQKISAPSGDTSHIVCPTCKSTAVNGMKNGTYLYRVTTTDNNKGTDTSQVQIIVNVSTTPPTVNAGIDQSITQPASGVTLTGTATANGGASMSSTTWTQVSGPATAFITSPGSLSTAVTGLSAPGVYTFLFSGTDSNGNVSTDTMTVTVLPAVNCNCSTPTNIKVI